MALRISQCKNCTGDYVSNLWRTREHKPCLIDVWSCAQKTDCVQMAYALLPGHHRPSVYPVTFLCSCAYSTTLGISLITYDKHNNTAMQHLTTAWVHYSTALYHLRVNESLYRVSYHYTTPLDCYVATPLNSQITHHYQRNKSQILPVTTGSVISITCTYHN